MNRKDKNEGKEGMLSKEFLDQIVSGDGKITDHLCHDCHNVPVCMIAADMASVFEDFEVAQIVKVCPYLVTNKEMEGLEENRNGDENS